MHASTYRCTCGAQLTWVGPVVTGEVVNGVRQCRRDAVCPACGQRYIARVTCSLFRPLHIRSERWVAVEADGAERAVTLEHVHAHDRRPARI